MKQWKHWTILTLGFVLMLVHNHADYLMQAYQHEWATWWDLHGRAIAWPWYLDVLPRDNWHLVQFIRNHTAIIATYAFAVGLSTVGVDMLYDLRSQKISCWILKHWYAVNFFVILALYGITRAVAFSLVKQLLN